MTSRFVALQDGAGNTETELLLDVMNVPEGGGSTSAGYSSEARSGRRGLP
jgi:hypothetical protein